ncbi:unnamed protein product [Euphydryas editha]|uniref:Uncharacterized protein n=1 Tax=Euphydryas editha TaxID=104508 RepID=A0AAU9UTY9_EUPED|nr:unnamed protein product [Euphydryas editha]
MSHTIFPALIPNIPGVTEVLKDIATFINIEMSSMLADPKEKRKMAVRALDDLTEQSAMFVEAAMNGSLITDARRATILLKGGVLVLDYAKKTFKLVGKLTSPDVQKGRHVDLRGSILQHPGTVNRTSWFNSLPSKHGFHSLFKPLKPDASFHLRRVQSYHELLLPPPPHLQEPQAPARVTLRDFISPPLVKICENISDETKECTSISCTAHDPIAVPPPPPPPPPMPNLSSSSHHHLKTSRELIGDFKQFHVHYKLHDICQCPSSVLIKKWVKKFEETGSYINFSRIGAIVYRR